MNLNKLIKMVHTHNSASREFRDWVDSMLPTGVESINANLVVLRNDSSSTLVKCMNHITEAYTTKVCTNPEGISSSVMFRLEVHTSKQQRCALSYLIDHDIESIYTLISRPSVDLDHHEILLRDWFDRGSIRCTASQVHIVEVQS
ncbi:hypothetical protein C5B77_19350 [Aeromonas salmonicida]|nr:hypothetical protein C5B77_19350 [Aeromonas salmonicida]